MKKSLLIILICAVILSTLFVPAFALAESQQITTLINPTALAIWKDYLFVADNVDVENNQAVILCFDVSNDKPVYKDSYELEGKVSKLSVTGDKLFVVTQDKVTSLTLSADSQPTVDKNYSVTAVDFAFGNSECVLTENKLLYTNSSLFDIEVGVSVSNAKSLIFFENYFYYLGDNCVRFDVDGRKPSTDTFNDSFVAPEKAKGLFAWGEHLGVYGSSTIYQVPVDYPTSLTAPITDLDYTVDSVAHYSADQTNRLYLLTAEKKKVCILKLTDGKYVDLGEDYTIGSDMVKIDVPTAYTGFTLATSKGYPTNVVYKTKESTSIDNILIGYTGQYIILNHENAENLDYYYVLVGDKFGWIKKSDNATTPQNDTKLQIIDTTVSKEITIGAKFTSIADVYLFDLPCSNPQTHKSTKLEQTALSQISVTIKQMFVEGNTIWYYVGYGEGNHAFVKSGDVGQIHQVGTSYEPIVGKMQINSSLFDAVKLNASSTLNGDSYLQENGEVVKLYSGERVNVIRQEENASFIQVERQDGSCIFGWVESSRLIATNAMTTNQIVGLIALGVAIALIVAFVVIFVKRKKLANK